MIIIGENINGTIPRVSKLIQDHDEGSLVRIAEDQEKAGADIIDINVGTGSGTSEDEARDMQWLVKAVMAKVKGKICVDSADTAVLRAGIESGGERVGLINSVKATDDNMDEVFPLAGEYGIPVVALAMDESGIPKDPASRLRACEKLVAGSQKFGIPPGNIFFDPLVMPVSTNNQEALITLDTLRMIRDRFPETKTVLAVSNVSFGLPKRTAINQSLIHMAQYLGVEALIMNPLDRPLMLAVRAGTALLGQDRHCRKYSRTARE